VSRLRKVLRVYGRTSSAICLVFRLLLLSSCSKCASVRLPFDISVKFLFLFFFLCLNMWSWIRACSYLGTTGAKCGKSKAYALN
jgi:hypothetical protein